MKYDAKRSHECSVCANDKVIWISTYSGYIIFWLDYKYEPNILNIDADDLILGSAIMINLQQSRWVLLRKEKVVNYPADIELDEYLSERSEIKSKYSIRDIMIAYKYKTKRNFFSGMKSCSVSMKSDIITINPTLHVGKYDNWSFSKELENVTIPSTSTAQEIGAAVRLGLSRCIG